MISSHDDHDPGTRDVRLTQWVMPAIQGLTTAALIALSGLVWRGTVQIERLADQLSVDQRERTQFYGNLVDGVHKLAEQSGMLTSADYCPVRFRIRFEKGLTYPLSQVIATLYSLSGEQLMEIRTPQPHSEAGTLYFGMLPPGTYRLKLAVFDSYALEHVFDVLPGLPVDHVVLCPHLDSPAASASTKVTLPPCLQSQGLVVVCHVVRDSVTLGNWRWLPIDSREITVVATTDGVDPEIPIESLARSGKIFGAPSTTIPYARCRLTGLTVFALDASPSRAPVELGTYCYSSTIERSSFVDGDHSDVTLLEGQAPAFYVSPLDYPSHQEWLVPLPEQVEAALKKRLCELPAPLGS